MSFLETSDEDQHVLADVLAFIDDVGAEMDWSSSGTEMLSQEDEAEAKIGDRGGGRARSGLHQSGVPSATPKRKRPTSAARNRVRVQRYHRSRAERDELRQYVAKLEGTVEYLKKVRFGRASAVATPTLQLSAASSSGEKTSWRAEATAQFQLCQRSLETNRLLKERVDKLSGLANQTSAVLGQWSSVLENGDAFMESLAPVPPWSLKGPRQIKNAHRDHSRWIVHNERVALRSTRTGADQYSSLSFRRPRRRQYQASRQLLLSDWVAAAA